MVGLFGRGGRRPLYLQRTSRPGEMQLRRRSRRESILEWGLAGLLTLTGLTAGAMVLLQKRAERRELDANIVEKMKQARIPVPEGLGRDYAKLVRRYGFGIPEVRALTEIGNVGDTALPLTAVVKTLRGRINPDFVINTRGNAILIQNRRIWANKVIDEDNPQERNRAKRILEVFNRADSAANVNPEAFRALLRIHLEGNPEDRRNVPEKERRNLDALKFWQTKVQPAKTGFNLPLSSRTRLLAAVSKAQQQKGFFRRRV